MSNYVKNENGYNKIKFNAKAVKEAYSKSKTQKKHPTSVNLPEDVITKLKRISLQMGVPYQTLMRKLIVEGLA
ncbi:MAG: hypothetical protein HY072_08095, partial [Deltaproteobacteria bacterium]|nr:hypothetical protein [Deltaproteobacteria bacterium]